MTWRARLARIGRYGLIALLALVVLLVVPLLAIGVWCDPFGALTPEAAASTAPATPRDGADENTARPEDQTYLTLPEWYIVYSADEFAAFIRDHPPSQFPYFSAVRQYWKNYRNVCAITRSRYPFNSGYHLTLYVIGLSFSAENILKGLYEGTVGRLTEWASTPELTAEDEFARQVAAEYGTFIHTIPWYEFPFGEKRRELWATTGVWGANPLRKWERKAYLGLQYGVESLYAKLIGGGTQAAYAPETLEVFASAEGVSEDLLRKYPEVRKVAPLDAISDLVAIPRYEAFTQVVPELTKQGVRFVEIAGNDEIMVTAIAPEAWTYDLPEGEFLYGMEILNQPGLQRMAIRAPVRSLHVILAELDREGIQLEHLYDY